MLRIDAFRVTLLIGFQHFSVLLLLLLERHLALERKEILPVAVVLTWATLQTLSSALEMRQLYM